MKKTLSWGNLSLIFIFLFAVSPFSSQAQFVSPTYTPYTWPLTYPTLPSNPVTRTLHTSNYSFTISDFNGTGVANNLYVHSWNMGGEPTNSGGTYTSYNCGIAWRRLDPSNTTVYDEGYINVDPDLMDLEVAMFHEQTQMYIVASYYKNHVGHFYDIYKWGSTGISLVSHNALTSQSEYTRISLDAHRLYGFSIVWQDIATASVNVVTALALPTLAVSNTVQLAGTSDAVFPDVAIGHPNTPGTLQLHIVYIENSTGNIVENLVDYATVQAAPPFTVLSPTVEDIIPSSFPFWTYGTASSYSFWVAATSASLNIDCPDHYDVDNWSYVYTDNSYDVQARVMDYHTSSITSYDLTDGSLGITAINGNPLRPNLWPTIGYDQTGKSIYYGWSYIDWTAPFPASSLYVAVKLNECCSSLVYPYYMIVDKLTSGTPAMSFSKQNDASTYFFSMYPQYSGVYRIDNKYIKWTSATFKPGPASVSNAADNITFYPNPFSDKLSVLPAATFQKQLMNVEITNIQGKVVGNYNDKGANFNTYLEKITPSLSNGIYIIKVNVPEADFSNTYKIEKIGQ